MIKYFIVENVRSHIYPPDHFRSTVYPHTDLYTKLTRTVFWITACLLCRGPSACSNIWDSGLCYCHGVILELG